MPEVRVGVPMVIEVALLPRLVGWCRARELLLTGNIIDAKSAHAMGLVQRLVPSTDLDGTINAWLDSILAAGPAALRDQKELLNAWVQLDLETAIETSACGVANAYRTEEPRRMTSKFLSAKPKAW